MPPQSQVFSSESVTLLWCTIMRENGLSVMAPLGLPPKT